MEKPRVKLDPETLSPNAAKLQSSLEDQLTSALGVATEQVDRDYSGETADEVARELLEQTKSGLHPDIAAGFSPDPTELHAVAEEIVRDNA